MLETFPNKFSSQRKYSNLNLDFHHHSSSDLYDLASSGSGWSSRKQLKHSSGVIPCFSAR